MRRRRRWKASGALLLGCVVALLGGCEPPHGYRDFRCYIPSGPDTPDATATSSEYTISDEAWDETAVRQVLHAFAFGGFASDGQVRTWADMPPTEAISEIISFETRNDKLSPPARGEQRIDSDNGSLYCLAGLFSTNAKDNPVPSGRRDEFALDAWDAPARIWAQAARTRGLNPVRQRVGLVETNYHMSVNQYSGVTNRQMIAFYDGIMQDLADGKPYEQVLTRAAISPAIATQYNHRKNVYENGKFSGNEDFAREYHQLFFGNLGVYDDAFTGDRENAHERITIPSTARALTGMIVTTDAVVSADITYGTDRHWQGPLSILETTVEGQTAEERFVALGPTAISHPESLSNLPVMLIRMLADDLLDPDSVDPSVMERVEIVRDLWAGMETKNLLEFLRKYAISTAFHNPSRVKYWTSIERNLLVENLISQNNVPSFREIYNVRSWMSREDVAIFRPAHDVFGGQTGLEAAGTADVFRNAYNRAVESSWSLTRVQQDGWRKDWSGIVPRGDGDRHRVRKTAEWLWQRFVADDLQNFGALERAHVYALLASGTDLAFWIDSASPDAVYTLKQVQDPGAIRDQVVGAELAFVNLDSDDSEERERANYRVSLAVNFIVTTPWFMAQQGR